MKKSKKLLIRYIEFFLKKYFFTSIYPFFVFLRTRKIFKTYLPGLENNNEFLCDKGHHLTLGLR